MHVVNRFDNVLQLAEIVLDIIGHDMALKHPAGPNTQALGDLSRSLDMYARPENMDALRGLIKKHRPDIEPETLDNIALGIKAAGSIMKLAYCSAMLVAGNPVPLWKMSLRHMFEILKTNDGIRQRLFGIMIDDGFDPDDHPPRGGKMRVPEFRRDTSAVGSRAVEQRAAVGGRRGMLRLTM